MIKLTKIFDLLDCNTEVVIHDMGGNELFAGKADDCPMYIFGGAYVTQMRFIEHANRYTITVKYLRRDAV